MQKLANILDIPFTTLSKQAVLTLFLNHLKKERSTLFVSTPNPEILLESIENKRLKHTLQNTDLNVPDGIGVIWAYHFLKNCGKTKPAFLFKALISLITLPFKKFQTFNQAITGTDLMKEITTSANFNAYRIFLLGARPGIAQQTKQAILKANSGAQIVGTSSANPNDNSVLTEIQKAKTDILFVAYGCPKQELWIAENLDKLKGVKLAMGIGGAFDFISGNIKRAPGFLRKAGLEWVFRLLQQPGKRLGRIYRAIFVFPYTIIKTYFPRN